MPFIFRHLEGEARLSRFAGTAGHNAAQASIALHGRAAATPGLRNLYRARLQLRLEWSDLVTTHSDVGSALGATPCGRTGEASAIFERPGVNNLAFRGGNLEGRLRGEMLVPPPLGHINGGLAFVKTEVSDPLLHGPFDDEAQGRPQVFRPSSTPRFPSLPHLGRRHEGLAETESSVRRGHVEHR